jgi:hypothetical protein
MNTLETAFSTGPGLFSVRSTETDKSIPTDRIRLYTVRVEAYDGPLIKNTDFDTLKFLLLPALVGGRPDVARAFVDLHGVLGMNLDFLRAEAAKK